jgi:hypothetical protein
MQTQHERPIAYGIQQTWLHQSELWRTINDISKTAANWTDVRKVCKIAACQNPTTLKSELQRQGFSTFILHLTFIIESQHPAQMKFWESIFGDPKYQSKAYVVYRIASP